MFKLGITAAGARPRPPPPEREHFPDSIPVQAELLHVYIVLPVTKRQPWRCRRTWMAASGPSSSRTSRRAPGLQTLSAPSLLSARFRERGGRGARAACGVHEDRQPCRRLQGESGARRASSTDRGRRHATKDEDQSDRGRCDGAISRGHGARGSDQYDGRDCRRHRREQAASALAMHIDQETISSLCDSIVTLEKNLDALNRVLTEQSSKEGEKDDDIDVYDYDKAWTDG